MKVEQIEITIADLFDGYRDSGEEGVVGYGGMLDIRPPYQREFIYQEKQRNDVLRSVLNGFPLNVMYWAKRKDGNYEVLDGQQRTLSICQYLNREFNVDGKYIHNQPQDVQDRINSYELMVYLCEGEDSEKLEWFKIVNIAGEELTNQELRNAVYAGSWVSDAKQRFSKRNCVAYQIGKTYLSGSPIRQDYLETAIRWISEDKIEDYMGKHQDDPSAEPLWDYFRSVIEWVRSTFKKIRPQMKRVDWGSLYKSYNSKDLDPDKIEEETAKLMLDDDVTNKSGIYPYILTRDEKHLNIRLFSPAMKQKAYEKQAGKCLICGGIFELSEMQADHIKPWIEGGKTIEENCQMLCKDDNRRKSDK